MSTFVNGTEFVVVACSAGCNLEFAMTRAFYDRTNRTGERWYCPLGHVRVWGGDTTETKLRKAEAHATHLEDQLRAAEADAESQRVQLIRDRVRYAAGLCPCCRRNFPALRAHIKTKHPTYDPRSLHAAVQFKCSCQRTFQTLAGLRIHQGKSRANDWADPKVNKWRRHLTVVTA